MAVKSNIDNSEVVILYICPECEKEHYYIQGQNRPPCPNNKNGQTSGNPA